MELVNQNFKNRIDGFDDNYVHIWIQFFVSTYNDTTANNNNDFELKDVFLSY